MTSEITLVTVDDLLFGRDNASRLDFFNRRAVGTDESRVESRILIIFVLVDCFDDRLNRYQVVNGDVLESVRARITVLVKQSDSNIILES